MNFKFYVLNYDVNTKKVISFNIFQNFIVQENSEKAIKKYLRAPSKYKSTKINSTLIGFEALCEEIDTIVKWQEWSRREYEISVADAFEEDINKFEKWDCYGQAKPNIDIITREIIYQYKQQIKRKGGDSN